MNVMANERMFERNSSYRDLLISDEVCYLDYVNKCQDVMITVVEISTDECCSKEK